MSKHLALGAVAVAARVGVRPPPAAADEEEVRWTGASVTWRRKDDGRWKVILDTGAGEVPKK